MGLSAYKQIRFSPIDGQTGTVQLVINRPGNPDLTQAATDTLLIALASSDPGNYACPFLESDFALSKKFTTTKGRRAMDDVSIQFRDGFGYKGTVNSSPVNENFLSIYQTFFDVWFNETAPYKAWILYHDYATGNDDVCGGWIDPTYAPSGDPYVLNPNTTNQIWCGSRTIKITALSSAQTSLTWQNVLQPYDATLNPNVPATYTGITASDCQEGTPYNGFFLAPGNYGGQPQSRDTIFGTGNGRYYLGVPYRDYQNKLQTLSAASWPATPWISNVANQIVPNDFAPNGTPYLLVDHGGSGYTNGDILTVTGGTGGTVQVATSGGIVQLAVLTNPGTGYTTGNFATTGGTGTGCFVTVSQVGNSVLYGPSGYVFIAIGTLFAKIAAAQGLSTFTPSTDLVSALDYFAQKADNTNKNFPIDTTPLALTNIWISLNVFAKSHPADGSYWDNPLGFSPTASISDVITGICNFLLSDFNEVWQTDGTSALQLKPMGTAPLPLPSAWQVMDTPSQDDNSNQPRIVQVNNAQDDLKIACPSNIVGSTVSVEVPLRLHRIAATSGSDLGPDQECLVLDSSKKDTEQADECFKVMWQDATFGNYVLNPNCWKSLACAFWFNASNTNVVYGSNWSPFEGAASWANSFYAINACYKSGQTPPANLQAAVKGGDYFNSRCYHAVAFAALTLSGTVVQTFQYAGVADSAGSIQNIAAGIAGTWRLGATASQHWRGTEVAQTLIAGNTTIKFQSQDGANGFPALTDLPYGVVADSGGTSSTSGGGTSSSSGGSGSNTTPTASAWPYIPITITGSGTQAIPTTATINVCSDNTTTGVSVAFGLVGNVVTIYNRTGNTFSTGDFLMPDSESWTCMFLDGSVQFDPLVKTGWAVLAKNP